MAKGKKTTTNKEEDFSDLLGEMPGGTDNMPNLPRETENTDLPDTVSQSDSFNGFEVVTDFRDVNDFDFTHRAGTDVSHLPAERLTRLLQLGYIKKV